MTTLPVQAPSQPKMLLWTQHALSRVAAAVSEVLDVFAEAQREARAAEKRYPFTVW